MDAIEILMNEHRKIELGLDALVAFVDEVQRTGSTDKEELSRFVTFLREFADAGHHAKEEGFLFEAMVQGGFPNEDGPIGVMLRDHDEGRGLVGILAERARQDDAWSEVQRRQIRDAGREFAELMRSHIQKEDEILYPMARHHLAPEAFVRVGEACARLDAERVQSGEARRMDALGEALVASHAPAAVSSIAE
jgi:hemerythrin-like domain-containing protein